MLRRENSSSCTGSSLPCLTFHPEHCTRTLTEEVGEVWSVRRQAQVLISTLLLPHPLKADYKDKLRIQLPQLTVYTHFTNSM